VDASVPGTRSAPFVKSVPRPGRESSRNQLRSMTRTRGALARDWISMRRHPRRSERRASGMSRREMNGGAAGADGAGVAGAIGTGNRELPNRPPSARPALRSRTSTATSRLELRRRPPHRSRSSRNLASRTSLPGRKRFRTWCGLGRRRARPPEAVHSRMGADPKDRDGRLRTTVRVVVAVGAAAAVGRETDGPQGGHAARRLAPRHHRRTLPT
jgi:hypothetical protein